MQKSRAPYTPLGPWEPWKARRDPRDKEGWLGLFIGGHGSGKSRCVRSILPLLDAHLEVESWLAFCGSRGSHDMLEGLVEPSFRKNPPTEQTISDLYDKRLAQVQIWEEDQEDLPRDEREPIPLMGVIFDDCGYNPSFTHIRSAFTKIINNMRHLGMVVIMACQSPQQLHRTILSQADFLAVMGDVAAEEEDELYKRILRGRMGCDLKDDRDALRFRLRELKVFRETNPGRRRALIMARSAEPPLMQYEWGKNPRVTRLGSEEYTRYARLANRYLKRGYTGREKLILSGGK